ncbi:cupin domain-containing protein [Halorientalis halophila]|uniref:cupin domain-containing protein n=1 Tax=Halorientalis halophila TaxID=3108499 RepID=UPI00300B9E2D
MPTEDKELFDPLADDSGIEWEPVEGYPDGIYEKVLYMDEDGSHSRILKFEPGVETDEVLNHDFYEEVYVISGGLIDKTLGEVFEAGTYACRTPGMEHGPYETPIGCMTFETRYYEDGN